MPRTYLFQASIGPVQSFIASARRTRDLWFGSWLLSELSRAAAQEVERSGGSLIFPTNLQARNVANKIVASINREPRQVGEEVKAAVKARLDVIWREVLTRQIKGPLTNGQDADKQIAALVECVWAAVPFDGSYYSARARLEALLAARKATRDFGPATWGRAVPKSSITGQMESVIPEDRYPKPVRPQQDKELQKKLERERQEKILALWEHYGAGQAERLSAVDLLKRHGKVGEQEGFLSTSHIAALPFLVGLKTRAEDAELQQIWKSYLAELKAQHIEIEELSDSTQPLIGKCDGAMLFGDRLDAQVANVASLSRAKEYLATFLHKCGSRPSPYYAILHADGDGMGAVIDHEATKGDEQHRNISQKLDSFARAAAQLVRGHAGAPIYTGGDDVLALLPLHTAIQCAKELAGRFSALMQGFTNKAQDGLSPTLSVGLAIVHHLTPLSDALDLARAAEKVAKKIDGKNALAIIVSKRSGGDTTVCGQWGDFDKQLEAFIDLHRSSDIPDGAAYELRDLAGRLDIPQEERIDLAGRLDIPQEERIDIFHELIVAEAGRILKHKRIASGEQQIPKSVRDLLVQRIRGDDAITDLRALADELIVARLFADARELAKWETPA